MPISMGSYDIFGARLNNWGNDWLYMFTTYSHSVPAGTRIYGN